MPTKITKATDRKTNTYMFVCDLVTFVVFVMSRAVPWVEDEVRTAKKAQRIDLNYFKHSHGRRWRISCPPRSRRRFVGVRSRQRAEAARAGPVSSAHAFAGMRCEVCHVGSSLNLRDPRPDPRPFFRAHTTAAFEVPTPRPRRRQPDDAAAMLGVTRSTAGGRRSRRWTTRVECHGI
jgi:hypothetical protein